MYASDPFLTLDKFEQVGLLAVSLFLSVLALLLVDRSVRMNPLSAWLPRLALGLLITGVIYWLFLWLSPQVYYTYYQSILSGLPQQSVIKAPPGLGRMTDILVFDTRSTLADHGRALLGWAMAVFAIFRYAYGSAPAHTLRR